MKCAAINLIISKRKRLSVKAAAILFVITVAFTSCLKDLDRNPLVGTTSANVYTSVNGYKAVLAKLYAGYAITGQQGPAGQPDVGGIDEGFSDYVRQWWQMNELTTDEAVIGWGDLGLPDIHQMSWSANNPFITGIYARIFYQITLANELIYQSGDGNIGKFSSLDQASIKTFAAEARFLRALSYWHALDMFGNVPFVTDSNRVGSYFPKQINRKDLFNYVENELLQLQNDLPAPRQNEYGRADKAAAWTVLAKLYLNAEVYTGTQRYTDCLTYTSKIAAAGYTLEPTYVNLFRTDNQNSKEIIFAIRYDGLHTQGYGGMTYLVHASVGGSMDPSRFGINGGWAGLRTTKNLAGLFPDNTGTIDARAQFYTTGQTIEISDITQFSNGYAVTKYRNVSAAGVPGSDPTGNFPDTDFPMFRLADIYLMYAEALLRGGSGGDMGTAISYINQLRKRAYGNDNGNVSSIDLNFILAERARELYWEGHRRTDLIRFGKFTDAGYLWPWKGGIQAGRGVGQHLSLFPIPSNDLSANPNLRQNAGY